MSLIYNSINDPLTPLESAPLGPSSPEPALSDDLSMALARRIKLIDELEALDKHVRRLKGSLKQQTKKSSSDVNFEARVRQNASKIRETRILSVNARIAVERYGKAQDSRVSTDRPISSSKTDSPVILEGDVDTLSSVKRRSAIQSGWTVVNKLEVFEEGGLAKSMDEANVVVLPQFSNRSILDLVEDCCRISISRPTSQLDLIAPWVPEGPRSLHVTTFVAPRRRAFVDRKSLAQLRSEWCQSSAVSSSSALMKIILDDNET